MAKKKVTLSKQEKKRFQAKKRLKNAIQHSQEIMLQRSKDKAAAVEMNFQIEPPGKEKMSEIIINYAKPLLEMIQSIVEKKAALTAAIALWNVALFPEKKQDECLTELMNLMKNSYTDKHLLSVYDKTLIYGMIERKKIYFPNIQRFVLDYDMIETAKGLHLNVVSQDINQH